jgi:Glutathione S-transferase, N-terminal domain
VGRSTYMRLFCFEFRVACSEYSEIESPLVAWDDRWNAMIELYQFPFSHYCEKVRWALDYKCITYLTINLLPGLHFRRLAKFVPKSSVPVLRDGKTVVQVPRPAHFQDMTLKSISSAGK